MEHELIDSYGEDHISEEEEEEEDGRGDVQVVSAPRSEVVSMIISPKVRDPRDDYDEEEETSMEPEDILLIGDGEETIELDAPDYSSDMSRSDIEEEPQEEEIPIPRVYDADDASDEVADGILSPRYANFPFERNSLVQPRKPVAQSHPYADAEPHSSLQFLNFGNSKPDLHHRGSELSLVDEEEDDAKKPSSPNVITAVSTPVVRSASQKFKGVRTHRDAQELVRAVRGEILSDASADPLTPGTADSGMSLSEQLAMYGETLEIERKLRKKEASKTEMNGHGRARVTVVVQDDQKTPTPSHSKQGSATPTARQTPTPTKEKDVYISSHSPLVSAPPRATEIPMKVVRDKGSAGMLKKLRRPHTSTGVLRRDGGSPVFTFLMHWC
jgi:hypothetical protein